MFETVPYEGWRSNLITAFSFWNKEINLNHWTNFQNPSFIPDDPMTLLIGVPEDPLLNCVRGHGSKRLEVCLFRQCSFCHIHRQTDRQTDYRHTVLSFRPGPVIEVCPFYGTQQSRCLPPFTWGRKQIHFPKRCVFFYLEFRTMDKVQKPSYSSVIHHRQNPTDLTKQRCPHG
jgi:hypothetical protein